MEKLRRPGFAFDWQSMQQFHLYCTILTRGHHNLDFRASLVLLENTICIIYYHFGVNSLVLSRLFLFLALNGRRVFDPPTSPQGWPACCHGSHSFRFRARLFP